MKRARISISLIAAFAVLHSVASCGGGGGGGDGPLSGGVEGFAFLVGGNILLLNSASSPPAGASPISGAAVTIDGWGGSASTSSTGRFLASGVPVGQRVMHVNGSGTSLNVPLTVVAAATIQTGAFTLSRQQAIDAALAALPGTPSDYRILASQQPLPTGVVLRPALGDDSGEHAPALDYAVPSPQFFIYADANAGERFQHDVLYILVDASTGVVTTRPASSWPQLNGVNRY